MAVVNGVAGGKAMHDALDCTGLRQFDCVKNVRLYIMAIRVEEDVRNHGCDHRCI